MIGSTIAHYRITAKLGEGGMGVVYRAADDRLNHAIVLELVEGEDLSERIQRGALPADDAREIALQIPDLYQRLG